RSAGANSSSTRARKISSVGQFIEPPIRFSQKVRDSIFQTMLPRASVLFLRIRVTDLTPPLIPGRNVRQRATSGVAPTAASAAPVLRGRAAVFPRAVEVVTRPRPGYLKPQRHLLPAPDGRGASGSEGRRCQDSWRYGKAIRARSDWRRAAAPWNTSAETLRWPTLPHGRNRRAYGAKSRQYFGTYARRVRRRPGVKSTGRLRRALA